MDNLGFLFAANLFVWLGVFIYLFRLMKSSQSLQKDLDLLKDSIKMDDGS